MTSSVRILVKQIQRVLDQTDVNHPGNIKTVTTPSSVASDNRHRPFLESLRNDLYHFDEEKKVRIIYSIDQYLQSNPDDDPELISVLERVLEIVQRFQQDHVVVTSPVKPVVATPPPSDKKPRKLFDDAMDALNSYKG